MRSTKHFFFVPSAPLRQVCSLLLLCSLIVLLAGEAFADRRGHGHYRRSSVSFGFYYGRPYWAWGYPYRYYAPYYYPYGPAYYPWYGPDVTIRSSPPVYIERSPSSSESGQRKEPAVWYYCPESKAYYPYVKECPGGWQTVPAQPPDKER